MKVLLTGAFGNLGILVLGKLVERGHEVVAFDLASRGNRRLSRAWHDAPRVEVTWGDIRDAEPVTQLAHRVDAVIHLAAIIPPFSESSPELAHAVNVGGTENVVRAVESATRPPLLVFGSSISVFGPRPPGAPLCTPDDPVVATDNYSGHKLQCEKRVRALHSPWAILRLAGMADSRMQQRDPDRARMALALAAESRVEFVHPDDAATALANVLDRPEAHGRIHLIGGGKTCQVTTLRMMQTLMGALGISIAAEDLGDEPTNAPWVDSTESQRLLAFQTRSLDDLERECRKRFALLRPLVRPFSPLIVRAMKLYLRGPRP